MAEENNNWKTKTLILGAAVGAIIGLGTGYLLTRTADETGGQPPKITTGDAFKIALGVIGVVRGIASLGDGK
jgi:hypothetical protein